MWSCAALALVMHREAPLTEPCKTRNGLNKISRRRSRERDEIAGRTPQPLPGRKPSPRAANSNVFCLPFLEPAAKPSVSLRVVHREVIITRQDPPYVPSELEEAFDAAWVVIGSSPRAVKYPEAVRAQLRLTLARYIVELSGRGFTDPQELRRRAIEHLILDE